MNKTGEVLESTMLGRIFFLNAVSGTCFSNWDETFFYSIFIFGLMTKNIFDVNILLFLSNLFKLSFVPYDCILSDWGLYSFTRPVKTSCQICGIVNLILHFRWFCVALIPSDEHKENKILSNFKDKIEIFRSSSNEKYWQKIRKSVSWTFNRILLSMLIT